MKNFLTDTLDPIERKYGKIILRNFPNYGVFWNKYIGVRLVNNMIRPYKIKYNTQYTNVEKRHFRNMFDYINMYHYSIFINFVSAHIQYDDIIAINKYKNIDIAHTKHWDAFENFYIRIGNVLNINNALWLIILNNVGYSGNRFNTIFKRYLINNRKKYLFNEYNKYNNTIKIIRNEVVHTSRLASSYIQGIGFFTIYRRNINSERGIRTWSKQIRSKKFIRTDHKTIEDLKNGELLLNALYEVLIRELDLYIVNKNIELV